MTSTIPTLEVAAVRYLEKWVLEEEPLYIALLATSPEEQRIALGRTVTYFRVVRNLRRREDELGVPRFEPLRQCLDAITSDDATNDHFAAATVALGQTIASKYGGKNYISVASKLLWMRFRHPFVIYDNQVRKALGTRSGDYHAYLAAWNAHYASREAAIRSACNALRTSLPRFGPCVALTDAYVSQIADEEWFRRRVMDIFIWLGGI